MPKVSIIIPVYKVPEKYLRQCIESCLGQTMADIEVIAVDDGSPDDCGRILDEYAAKDPRLKVIHKENGGLVSARNAGYEAVTAPWHMYLDGDDYIDLDTCEKLYQSIESHKDVDIVFWKFIQELDEKSIKGKLEWSCPKEEEVYEGNDACRELARNTLIYKSGIATAYCKLIRTDYARNNGIHHDPRLRQGSEGLEFSLRAFYNARKALFLNKYFNHYIYNPVSISKAVNEKNTVYLTDCYNAIYEFVKKIPEYDEFRKVLYQRIIYVLIAVALGTYFHPSNPDSFFTKKKKYKKVINDTPIYKEALKKGKSDDLDKLRRIALSCIKARFFYGLKIIASMKMWFIKRGKFNY